MLQNRPPGDVAVELGDLHRRLTDVETRIERLRHRAADAHHHGLSAIGEDALLAKCETVRRSLVRQRLALLRNISSSGT